MSKHVFHKYYQCLVRILRFDLFFSWPSKIPEPSAQQPQSPNASVPFSSMAQGALLQLGHHLFAPSPNFPNGIVPNGQAPAPQPNVAMVHSQFSPPELNGPKGAAQQQQQQQQQVLLDIWGIERAQNSPNPSPNSSSSPHNRNPGADGTERHRPWEQKWEAETEGEEQYPQHNRRNSSNR